MEGPYYAHPSWSQPKPYGSSHCSHGVDFAAGLYGCDDCRPSVPYTPAGKRRGVIVGTLIALLVLLFFIWLIFR